MEFKPLKQLDENELSITALEFTTKLLEMSLGKFVDVEHMRTLIGDLYFSSLEEKMYFLTSFIGVLRKLPVELFTSLEVREQLVHAAQEILDEIILEENVQC